MNRILRYAGEAQSIVILGHVHPDGDCVGACLGMYNLLRDRLPEKHIQVVLEEFAPEFGFLAGASQVSHDFTSQAPAELCICLDASDVERLGAGARLLREAKHSICIDHHITNTGFAEWNLVKPQVSSASEIVATLLPAAEISLAAAECLYLGIVHDTGVFKHSNTSEETMRVAGALLGRGVSSAKIIDDTFYKKTFVQNRILGWALLQARLFLDGRVIASVLPEADMKRFGATKNDLEGIIDQLRITDGVEMAALLYEAAPGEFKISLRSNLLVDVSRIAGAFEGGGHVRAAGGRAEGDPWEVIRILSDMAQEQITLADRDRPLSPGGKTD